MIYRSGWRGSHLELFTHRIGTARLVGKEPLPSMEDMKTAIEDCTYGKLRQGGTHRGRQRPDSVPDISVVDLLC